MNDKNEGLLSWINDSYQDSLRSTCRPAYLQQGDWLFYDRKVMKSYYKRNRTELEKVKYFGVAQVKYPTSPNSPVQA